MKNALAENFPQVEASVNAALDLRRHLPVMSDKKPQGVVLSASQISRYDDCKRWWAWEYIAGFRSPPNAAAKLGSAVHTQLENWLSRAIPPDDSRAGKIATKMLRYLPQPGTGEVERKFFMTTARGHHYTGYIDWTGYMDIELGQNVVTRMAIVLDHKTSSNVALYGKTASGLHNDVQALMYAAAAFVGYGCDQIGLFWNYGDTKNPRAEAHPVRTIITLDEVVAKFEQVIEPIAAEITAHRIANIHPLSLPPSISSCGNYGGCPHVARCNLTQEEKLDMTNPGTNTMADRMAQVQPGSQPGALPTAPPATEPAAPPPQAGVAVPPATAPVIQTQAAPPPVLPAGPPVQQAIPAAAPPGAAAAGFVAPPAAAPPGAVAAAPPPGASPAAAPVAPPVTAQVQTPVYPPGAGAYPPGAGAPPGAPPVTPMAMLPPATAGEPAAAPPGAALPAAAAPATTEQPYAPAVAPDGPQGPEAGQTLPLGAEDAKTDGKGKAGPGRPRGTTGKKTFTVPEQAFMMGVTAVLPRLDFSQPEVAATQAQAAGRVALAAFQAEFPPK